MLPILVATGLQGIPLISKFIGRSASYTESLLLNKENLVLLIVFLLLLLIIDWVLPDSMSMHEFINLKSSRYTANYSIFLLATTSVTVIVIYLMSRFQFYLLIFYCLNFLVSISTISFKNSLIWYLYYLILMLLVIVFSYRINEKVFALNRAMRNFFRQRPLLRPVEFIAVNLITHIVVVIFLYYLIQGFVFYYAQKM